MNRKEYKLPNGKKAVFEYDINGVGKITLECMDELMAMIADRPSAVDLSSVYPTAYKSGCERGKADRPQGWIPCSERLPSEKEWTDAYIRNKKASEFFVMIKGADRPTTLYLSRDHYWFDENRDFYEVVAWMPMPEPWKGADHE